MNATDVIENRTPWHVHTGDSLVWLRTLPPSSVRCCVTSPPYYGLRNYQTGTWEGGDPECDHQVKTAHQKQGATSQRKGRANADKQQSDNYGSTCPKCGAVRSDPQIGIEDTPEAYIENLVLLFRRVRRALTDDGTLFLNIGDSYNSAGRTTHGTQIGRKQQTNRASANGVDTVRSTDDELKPKDIMMIPARVALALQADGWYLRCDMIWHSTNKMPESVTDRPTRNHEYVFLLAKSERYYYDADAIKEKATSTGGGASFGKQSDVAGAHAAGQQSRTYERPDYEVRNCRSVWSIPTRSSHHAHFAVMPPALAVRCILAGSAPGDVVLDPFTGSGTTLIEARKLRRRAIGCELNSEYADLSRKRTAGAIPGLM